MTAYLIRRFIQGFIVLVISTALIYFVLTLIPGGPLTGARAGNTRITQADITRVGYLLGINDRHGRKYEWYERYTKWLFNPDKNGIDLNIAGLHIHGGGILTGDWGRSLTFSPGKIVINMIGERVGFTLILMTAALIIPLILAIPIGIISAVRQYSKLDYTVTLLSFFGTSMPTFWLGWMLIIIFGVLIKQWHPFGWDLPYFPTDSAYDVGKEGDIGNRIWHLVLPVTVLSTVSIAGWSRFLRSSVLEVLRLDYVRTAWAKGLKQRTVIVKHAVRNALIPLITLVTLSLPGLFGGAIVTEGIFAYPGLGSLYLDAVGAYDWPIVMAYLLIITSLNILSTILADVLYAVADPRIRYA